MKKTLLFIICMVISLLIAKQFIVSKDEPKIINNVYPVGFSGKTEVIIVNRGFKVKLDNGVEFFNMSGTCNDTACLAQNITWGDSLIKQANSRIVILKSKVNGKVSKWQLPVDH